LIKVFEKQCELPKKLKENLRSRLSKYKKVFKRNHPALLSIDYAF